MARRPTEAMATNAKAESLFKSILPILESDLGDGITNARQLDSLGRALFKSEWRGVHAADDIKEAIGDRPAGRGYFIANTDVSTGQGIHWMGIYCDESADRAPLIFDSFGRKTAKALPELRGVGRDTDHDKNQRVAQQDCGSRSMAFLVIAKYWGYDFAALL